MDKSWKKLFEQKIRSRGKEYAYYCVSGYTSDESGYSATVRGSEDYKVMIFADYSKMSCSCPYAKDGKHCKHMAAVLYYAELLEKQKKEAERKADEKAARREQRIHLQEMKKTYGINLQPTLLRDVQSVTEWKKEVNRLINHFKNKDGYIGYWEADSFIDNLLDCFKTLYSFVGLCADKKAIDASIWLYRRILDVGVDDSSTGCTGYFEEEMLDFWEGLSEYSDKNRELIITALQPVQNRGQAVYDFLGINADLDINFDWEDPE